MISPHAVRTEKLKPETLEESKKLDEAIKEGKSFGHTSEEWAAIKAAEKRTLKGKIKYAWKDYLYYPVRRKWNWLKDIPNEIKYFWQRGKRGYSDRDAWGIDNYLSSFMPEMLRKMVDEEQGGGNSYPAWDDPNADTFEHWKATVEKMARGFEAAREIDEVSTKDIKQYRREVKRLQREFHDGMKLFDKYYFTLWD